MYGAIRQHLTEQLEELKRQGLYKEERIITSPQGAEITVAPSGTGVSPDLARAEGAPDDGTGRRNSTGAMAEGTGDEADDEVRRVINFCANNYLGLAGDPEMTAAATAAMEERGFGYASVRFICGTADIHRRLERRLADFLGTDDTILYAAAFDANGGVFEPLLGEEDAIISDELNHASIIDGVRLCKAKRYRYRHADGEDLRRQLETARKASARHCVIATDGVFSMDGDIAPLPDIVQAAEEFDALVMVDDCHATGYLGPSGAGTADYWGLRDAVDIVTGTLGKALGGASGGFVSGRREIVEMLRQRSRPYLFSNTLAPGIAGAALRGLEIVRTDDERRKRPLLLADRLRKELRGLGFDLLPSETAIIAVMIYDEPTALEMASRLLDKGIYVIGFAFPVVPRGKARIRLQLSAAHRDDHIDTAVHAFRSVGREMGIIG